MQNIQFREHVNYSCTLKLILWKILKPFETTREELQTLENNIFV